MVGWAIKCYRTTKYCCQIALFVGINSYDMKYCILISCFLILSSCGEAQKNAEMSLEDRAMEIHQKVITIDTHNDINVKNFTDEINYTQRLETQVNLPKMEEGGLDVTWLIVYTGQDSLNEAGYTKAKDNAMAKFEAIHRFCDEIANDQIELALTSEDVRRIDAAGKKVAMIGVENAYPIGEDLAEFEKYQRLGARYISLSHNGHSQFSDSNTGEKDSIWLYNGLSDLGKQAVYKMNRLCPLCDDEIYLAPSLWYFSNSARSSPIGYAFSTPIIATFFPAASILRTSSEVNASSIWSLAISSQSL